MFREAYELKGGFGIDSLVLPKADTQPDRQCRRCGRGRSTIRSDGDQGQLSTESSAADDAFRTASGVSVGQGVSRISVVVAGIFMPKWLESELTEAKAKARWAGDAWRRVRRAGRGRIGLGSGPSHHEEAATLPCAAVTPWHAVVASGR